MSEELDLLILVVDRLDALSIPSMVSGSIAMNVYAEPRMTRDIDIVVAIRAADVDAIVAAFADDFYCDREMIRHALDHEGSFNLIHTPTVIKVDFLLRKNTPYRLVEFGRRRALTVGGHVIHVVAPEDLVLSKLAWAKPSHSEVQLRDVRNLIACVPDLDWRYLERWAADLTVTDLLAEVRP
ncbi:MAG: hypothetical protein IT293_06475 [Deltaproteobacteria bacterium]|nr:hypothetical protein [Deltaproteobacteria bacterium]